MDKSFPFERYLRSLLLNEQFQYKGIGKCYQQNNILKYNYRMEMKNIISQQKQESRSKHQCHQCIQNEAIFIKYTKLIDLLYKKIKQLQKKSKSQLLQQEPSHEAHFQINSDFAANLQRAKRQNLTQSISDTNSLPSQNKSFIEEQNRLAFTTESFKKEKFSPFENNEIEKLEKVSIVINALTEEVMQLKSNLMHIRYCIYAFFKELNMSEKISSNPIALNITLALISLFEFSQNEKEEMFNNKKVKLRKKQKNCNKENVFVTIKEI